MGHLRVYTIGDVIARFERMSAPPGTVVVNPMGWDAFGLPAENAAIDRGVDPDVWTRSNIESMRAQLLAMGTSFDWEREVATFDPEYYKWTQFLFLKMHEAGLVYRKEAVVNWDPVDQTVLANEQVDAEGRAERSGALVEKRNLKQWFLRITDYADELLRDLELLDWPDKVKQSQIKWIGRTSGYEYTWDLQNEEGKSMGETLTIFAEEEDAATKAAFVAIGPSHPILDAGFFDTHQRLSTGLWARSRDTGRKLPVIVSGFVSSETPGLSTFGIPESSRRIADFAQEHGISAPQPASDVETTEHLKATVHVGFIGNEHGCMADSSSTFTLLAVVSSSRLACEQAEVLGYASTDDPLPRLRSKDSLMP
ncbi:hypothetical protein HK405_003844 [Cladochytrium tenue]|nr:hypothetical protein HK405_003844 [Cladochytrium tenue]